MRHRQFLSAPPLPTPVAKTGAGEGGRGGGRNQRNSVVELLPELHWDLAKNENDLRFKKSGESVEMAMLHP